MKFEWKRGLTGRADGVCKGSYWGLRKDVNLTGGAGREAAREALALLILLYST